MEMKKRCCIKTCRSERFDLTHRFPRIAEVTSSWLEAIDDPGLKEVSLEKLCTNYQVCARHFRIDDYKHPESRSLNRTAIPSLNLKDLSQLHLSRNSTGRQIMSKHLMVLIEEVENQLESPSRENYTTNDSVYEDIFEDIEALTVPTEEIQQETQVQEHDEYIPNQSIIADDADESKTCPKVDEFSHFVEVTHPKHANKLSLNSFWLRCHCYCSQCFDRQKKRKKINPLDILSSIQPNNISPFRDGDQDMLLIQWNDGHDSKHNIEFLFKSQAPKVNFVLGKLSFASTPRQLPHVDFSKLVTTDIVENIFENLILYGIAIVTQIPAQNSSMAKLTIERLFPHLETKTFEPFNEIHSDISTNLTCDNFDCGLKCFFATREAKIILVDGLNVAQKLKETDFRAFEMLTNTKVPLEIQNNNVFHKTSRPVIKVDPETTKVSRVQLDVHSMSLFNTLSQVQVESFYDSLKLFMTALRDNRNQISLTLLPGTMLILDNWRVLHKFTSAVGVLQCYLERKNYVSRSRFFGLQ